MATGGVAVSEPSPLTSGWKITESGSGTPLVFVHGLGTDAAAWDRVVPALGDRHRVITVDLPGYSLRTAVDAVPHADDLADGLATLLDELGIRSAVLVGHSFGGVVCLIAAGRHPQRCAGLVLVAPGGFGTELNPLIPLVGTRFGSRMLRSLYGPRASRTIERLAARVQARPGPPARVRIAELMETYERLRSDAAREQFQASVREILALNSGGGRDRLTQIDQDIPVLVLWGREDRVLPAWHAHNAARLLPWAIVHFIDGAGHTPHRSHPRQTAREIGTFSDSTEVRSRLNPTGS
jgi:pimeloyl-ACP methyl ester carboxylesterase